MLARERRTTGWTALLPNGWHHHSTLHTHFPGINGLAAPIPRQKPNTPGEEPISCPVPPAGAHHQSVAPLTISGGWNARIRFQP